MNQNNANSDDIVYEEGEETTKSDADKKATKKMVAFVVKLNKINN